MTPEPLETSAATAAPPPAEHAAAKRRALFRTIAIGAVAVVANVLAYLLLPPDLVKRLGAFSYVGVFFITLLANATTIVPTPYIPIVACIAAGSVDALADVPELTLAVVPMGLRIMVLAFF